MLVKLFIQKQGERYAIIYQHNYDVILCTISIEVSQLSFTTLSIILVRRFKCPADKRTCK